MRQSSPLDIQPPWWNPKLYYCIFIVVCTVAVIPIFLRPARFLLDDSVFYLQIANNFAKGLGSTFNGVTLTNGYHPLWMVVCAALSLLVGNDKALLLYCVAAAQASLFIAIVFFFRSVIPEPKPYWKWSLPVLAAFFWGSLVFGSEACINGLALMVFWRFCLAKDRGAFQEACLGLSLGMAFLARLDNVFIAAVYFIARLFGGIRARNPDWRGLLTAGAGAAIPAISYLIINQLYFGHPLPISGAIKSSFPHPVFNLHALGKLGAGITLLSAITLFCMGGKKPIPFSLPLFSINAGFIGQTFYDVFFTLHHTAWHWYYVAGALNAAYLLPFAALILRKRCRAFVSATGLRAFGIAFFTSILIAVAAKNWLQYRAWSRVWYDHIKKFDVAEPWPIALAHTLDSLLPPETRIMVFDQPGFIAYYSHLSVQATDGLTMNYDYGTCLRELGAASYMKKESLRYFLVPNRDWGDRRVICLIINRGQAGIAMHFFSPLGGADAGIITLPDSCMVRDLSGVLAATNLALWKLPS